MMGRADKGIIITTGTFTVEAIKEARRDSVPSIEIVAGDDLIRLFEELELGLIQEPPTILMNHFFRNTWNSRTFFLSGPKKPGRSKWRSA